MVLHISEQIGSSAASMVAGAAVMHIAERTLNGIGPRAGGRQQQQPHARVSGQPWRDSFGLMDFIVIHNDVAPGVALGRLAGL
jgi:hypothetical protein